MNNIKHHYGFNSAISIKIKSKYKGNPDILRCYYATMLHSLKELVNMEHIILCLVLQLLRSTFNLIYIKL